MVSRSCLLPKRAFSLVELSIVLVILGLLVGGVLSGQSLIRAAQIRSVSSEFTRYATAVGTFRDKYFALPGDMNNAQSFWGVAHATAATCVTTAGIGNQTCNGDSDGIIYPSTGSNESLRFWQHLASAGLIEGSYDGITHGTGGTSSTTANSPASKLGSSALWWVWYYGAITGSVVAFDATYGNFLQLGIQVPNAPPTIATLKPEEIWNIDTKVDDGKPATGRLLVWANSGLATCTDTATSSNLNASYLLSSNAIVCNAILRQAF